MARYEQLQSALFYYRAIAAKLLRATGKMNRAKLPACVYAKIEELHPRQASDAPKVGYKRARAE